MSARQTLPSSFRDPSGFLYHENGTLYRQVNPAYRENYDLLLDSGLYQDLVGSELLIPHEEAGEDNPLPAGAYKVLKPEPVPFISYPYEWSFSQFRDAALTTLRIQKRALEFGLSLKDCSAYNIQFRRGKPVLIDTLSFERYREGEPWVAYRQYCQHFLAPLALMSYTDVRLSQLLRIYVDGVPLDLASRLLPFSTRLRFSLLSHIHLHARTERHYAGKRVDTLQHRVSRTAFLALLDNLESATRGLKWQPTGTAWADYYADTNYSADALQHKAELVRELLESLKASPGVAWDLGANTGLFSRIASDQGWQTISFDNDPACVERNYLECIEKGETRILPLLVDLTNPSANVGWAHEERMSLLERGPADVALALALIHHLAISNNLPLGKIAHFCSRLCNTLIIEFVPKADSQVQRLLASRDDIFTDYTQTAFEAEFGRYFSIERAAPIRDTERTLYLMQRKSPS